MTDNTTRRASHVAALQAELAAVKQSGRGERIAAIEAELARFGVTPAVVETAAGTVKGRARRGSR